MNSGSTETKIVDQYGVGADRKMPALARAVDPGDAARRMERCCRVWLGGKLSSHLKEIRVVHYRPERLCVIEYDLDVQVAPEQVRALTLVGRTRAKGTDTVTYELVRAIRRAGFDDRSNDGISVAEPVCVISQFQMWFQLKPPAVPVSERMAGKDGVSMARRVAEAAQKLHQAGVPSRKTHFMADELRLLHERLHLTAAEKPEWAARLESLFAACSQLGANVPPPQARGIQRVFSPANLFADEARIWLTDFDAYCQGDPALDIGNFVGSLMEMSLHSSGKADGYSMQERALIKRFLELNPESSAEAVSAYTTLTLARLIQVNRETPGREALAEKLLGVCEERLGIVADR